MGNMAMGYGQTQAGNEINYAKAKADNENTFTNNMLNTAGAVAKVAGAAYGVPPIGGGNAMQRPASYYDPGPSWTRGA